MAEDEAKTTADTDRAVQAAKRLLEFGNVLELPSLGQNMGTPDGPENVVRITGDVMAGASIQGARSVVVEGSIVGQPQQVCRIDISGDLVVLGSVRQAEICGNRVAVGKWCSKSVLVSERDVEICGDAVDLRLTAGGAGLLKRQVERLAREVAQDRAEAGSMDQTVKMEQRRTDKLLQATRIAFDFNIGEIVMRRGKPLEIDLDPFYQVVGDKAEEEVDRALLEFFSRAVVGLITRVNRNYITENVNNRKIFTAVVRRLHDLMFLVRKRDKLAAAAELKESELKDGLDGLPKVRPRVFVGGSLMPEIDMEFVLPQVSPGREGDVTIGQKAARWQLKKGANGEQRQVVQVHASGEDATKVVDSKAMVGLVFQVEDGAVSWKYAQGLE